jgi:hypothetical protein
MVAHRKNVPPGKAYVPSSWLIVLTVMVLIGGAGWLGWLLVDDDQQEQAAPAPAVTASSATPTPTAPPPPTSSPTPKATGTPKPTKTPEPAATTTPAPARTATVSVLNNSGITGLARSFSGQVTAAGWRLGGIGNWTGSIGGNTIYYPAGLEPQARLLAADVGIERLRPSIAPMRSDRLTVILSGPQ